MLWNVGKKEKKKKKGKNLLEFISIQLLFVLFKVGLNIKSSSFIDQTNMNIFVQKWYFILYYYT